MVIGVYDVVYAAGRTNMGAKAIAAMLPNDGVVKRQFGSRLLLFHNVIAAKFTAIVKPVGERLLRPDQAALVQEDAFLAHTLLHEMAHALVGYTDEAGASTSNEKLRERYSTVEECRADLVGLVFLDLLTQRGLFPPPMAAAAVATFLAGLLRTLRFGVDNDYSRAAAITLSHMLRQGVLTQENDRRLAMDIQGVYRSVNELAQRVQTIAISGDYDAAGSLVAELGWLPPEISALLSRLDDVPIDLEFVFDPSLGAR
jgi:hypothetical protein